MPDPPFGELKLDVRLVGDPDRGRGRQLEGEGFDDVDDERPRAEIDRVHREHSGEPTSFGGADRESSAVEPQRKPAASPRGVGHDRGDVGENTLRHRRLQPRVREELHRLDVPFAPLAVRSRAQRGPHVNRIAHPLFGRPRAIDPHDRADDVELHPDRTPPGCTKPFSVGNLGEVCVIRGPKQPFQIRIAVSVEHHVGLEAFDPQPAEIAQRHDDAGQTVADLHPLDRDRLA